MTDNNTWKKIQLYTRNVMPMWRYRLTDLLCREYWRLEMPAALAAESHYRRNWNLFLDRHYRRKWNVRVSKVMDNATHVAMYFGSYLKKPPVAMSRLEHYARRDEIIMRYRSHRTKQEEALTLSFVFRCKSAHAESNIFPANRLSSRARPVILGTVAKIWRW